MNHLILAPLLLPLAAGMINLQRGRKGLAAQRCVSIVSTTGVLLAAILLTARAAAGQIETYALGGWPAPFGIVLVLDRLSALMLLVTALLALPVLVHACAGDDRCGRGFHVLFPIQLLGVNGAFLTGDLFNLFVFFEILLIASYCLALHGSGPARTRATLRYVVLNLVGSSLFLVALGAVYGACGTLNMADLAGAVAGASPEKTALLRAASLLLLCVFGLKAAVVPLMTWLPGLYCCRAALRGRPLRHHDQGRGLRHAPHPVPDLHPRRTASRGRRVAPAPGAGHPGLGNPRHPGWKEPAGNPGLLSDRLRRHPAGRHRPVEHGRYRRGPLLHAPLHPGHRRPFPALRAYRPAARSSRRHSRARAAPLPGRQTGNCLPAGGRGRGRPAAIVRLHRQVPAAAGGHDRPGPVGVDGCPGRRPAGPVGTSALRQFAFLENRGDSAVRDLRFLGQARAGTGAAPGAVLPWPSWPTR